MSATTGIAWTDATWNPWYGCKEVSPGCDHCYAHRDMTRYGRRWTVTRAAPATFEAPLKWEREAAARGRQTKVFTCSWSDFFIREADPWREEAWAIIRATPHLTYQVLTKRPGLLIAWAKTHGWLPNTWAGTSIESQKYAPRLDVLCRLREMCPWTTLFASCEPLLGPLDLTNVSGRNFLTGEWSHWEEETGCICSHWDEARQIQWCIVGGESGPQARPMDLAWARSLVQQCAGAAVPVFVKQLGARPLIDPVGLWGHLGAAGYPLKDPKGGEPAEWPADLRVRQFPSVAQGVRWFRGKGGGQ